MRPVVLFIFAELFRIHFHDDPLSSVFAEICRKEGMGGFHFHGDGYLPNQLCPVSDGAGGIPAQRLDHNLMVS
jgi:hypothetical protein